jgi:hypothetical protein
VKHALARIINPCHDLRLPSCPRDAYRTLGIAAGRAVTRLHLFPHMLCVLPRAWETPSHAEPVRCKPHECCLGAVRFGNTQYSLGFDGRVSPRAFVRTGQEGAPTRRSNIISWADTLQRRDLPGAYMVRTMAGYGYLCRRWSWVQGLRIPSLGARARPTDAASTSCSQGTLLAGLVVPCVCTIQERGSCLPWSGGSVRRLDVSATACNTV